MKNTAIFIILITTNILVHTAALETPAPDQNIKNISCVQKDGLTIINYQLNDHAFSFNAKILAASNTIKNLQGDCHESLAEQTTFITRQLFDGLDHEQIKLLIKALKRNSACIIDETKPSPGAELFVHKLKTKDQLCWITDQANRWDIHHIYHAAVKRIADCITYGKNISLHILNDDIGYDVKQNIDCTDLKKSIRHMLQETIAPFGPIPNCILLTKFNNSRSQLLCAIEESNRPIYVYDIASKQIIHNLMLPADAKLIQNVQYAYDNARILVKTGPNHSYDLSGTLYAYDIKQPSPLLSIPIKNIYRHDDLNNDFLQVSSDNCITVHSQDEISCIKLPEGYLKIYKASYSPDRSHIYVETYASDIGPSNLFIYDASSKNLLATIECCNFLYSTDNLKLLVKKRGGVYIYNARALENRPEKIVSFEGLHCALDMLFSPDNKQALILSTESLLHVYDITTGTAQPIKIPFDTFLDSPFVQYSHDGSRILVGRIARESYTALAYDAKNPTEQPQRIPYTATLTNSNTHIITTLRDSQCTIQPTLHQVHITDDLQHIQLLFKACNGWLSCKKPYAITTQEEKEVYDSLDPLLQDERLFKLDLKQTKEPAS